MMPIYEYTCSACGSRASVFVKSTSSDTKASCVSCGSRRLGRVVSGFAVHKSEQSRREESRSIELNPGDDYHKDPRSIERWAEKSLDELGVDMPQQTKEMIDATRDGELPPVR